MGTKLRGTAHATEPATAATGLEASPPKGTPSAIAAGGDGASPMEAAGAPMVNADDAGECSSQSESDDAEDEPLMDVLRKLHGWSFFFGDRLVSLSLGFRF
mmetsp:Transcript_13011/g.50871  ORF Transcript_13011/g.50871 Transcript_13011/m.50871 type:complete len:101 (-) Transcript_13011:1740-2042(-)